MGQDEVQKAARLDPDVVAEAPDLAQQILALHQAVENLAAVVAGIDERLIKTDEKIDQRFDHVTEQAVGLGKRTQIVEVVVRQNQEKLNWLTKEAKDPFGLNPPED